MNYYVHSKKIKAFSIIMFIINIAISLALGIVFPNFYGERILEKYNWWLAVVGILISIIIFIICYIFVVNAVQAIEDITKAISEGIPIICSNKRRVAQLFREVFTDTANTDDIHSRCENLLSQDSWKCSVCGRINHSYDITCKCGELKSFE